jgi:Cys-rich protein (TIGR01571 family)
MTIQKTKAPTPTPYATAIPATATATPVATPSETVGVVAPSTLPGGATFEAVVDGIQFTATVPMGGVVKGETFYVAFPPPASNFNTSNNTDRIWVKAPATLNTGDQFEAQVDGIRFMATVPEGGVREGALFETIHPAVAAQQNQQMVPTGRWRNELCDCCNCNARDCLLLCCMGTFCNLVLRAQMMQRLGLTLSGCRPSPSVTSIQRRNVCPIILIVTVIVYFLHVAAMSSQNPSVTLFMMLVSFGWSMFLLVALTCARASMRAKYQLPGTCCSNSGCLDDCCITYWCGCCSAIQMISHTHNASVYPYDCCSQTGLGRNAPEIV